jgi:hypothetical protein
MFNCRLEGVDLTEDAIRLIAGFLPKSGILRLYIEFNPLFRPFQVPQTALTTMSSDDRPLSSGSNISSISTHTIHMYNNHTHHNIATLPLNSLRRQSVSQAPLNPSATNNAVSNTANSNSRPTTSEQTTRTTAKDEKAPNGGSDKPRPTSSEKKTKPTKKSTVIGDSEESPEPEEVFAELIMDNSPLQVRCIFGFSFSNPFANPHTLCFNQVLSLRGNEMTWKGLSKLFQALRTNKTLMSLSLWKNFLGLLSFLNFCRLFLF